jgi:hypothetical protein
MTSTTRTGLKTSFIIPAGMGRRRSEQGKQEERALDPHFDIRAAGIPEKDLFPRVLP